VVAEWYASRGLKDIQVITGGSVTGLATDIEGSAHHVHPDWSPDGKQIAFEVFDESSGNAEVWVMDGDGSDPNRVVACSKRPCLQYAYPSWSHDGTRLAVIRFDQLKSGDWGPSAVEILDLTTGNARVAAELPDGVRCFSETPRWSPDDSRIVAQIDSFATAAEEDLTASGLTVFSAGGPASQKLLTITKPSLFAAYPDWHPSEDLIVFNDHDLGSFQAMSQDSALWVIAPDGSGLRQLTSGQGKFAQASWSADGTQLVLVQATGADQVSDVRIALLPAKGGTPVPLGVSGAHPRLQP
jgi:TolB protein